MSRFKKSDGDTVSVFIAIMIALPAALALAIAKSWQLSKQLLDHSYSWRHFAFISIVWSTMTFPFIAWSCHGIACGWSIRFGWWLNLIGEVPPFSELDPTKLVAGVMLGYLVLTIYFFAHCLGWMIYAARRLVRLAA